jgi:hypothetical protein
MLCCRHPRLKTHGGRRDTVLEPGSYLWTSPHGYSSATTTAPSTSAATGTRPRCRTADSGPAGAPACNLPWPASGGLPVCRALLSAAPDVHTHAVRSTPPTTGASHVSAEGRREMPAGGTLG